MDRKSKDRYVIFAGTSEGRKLYEFCAENSIDAIFCVATEYGKEILCKQNMPDKYVRKEADGLQDQNCQGEETAREMAWEEIDKTNDDMEKKDNIRDGRGEKRNKTGIEIHVGRMNAEEMTAFFRRERPRMVIDATHPYATEVTENIRNAAEAYRREKSIEEKVYYRVLRKLDNVGDMKLCKLNTSRENVKLCKPTKNADETELYDSVTDAEQTDETKISYHKDMQQAVCYLQSTEGNILATTGSKQAQELCKLKGFEKRVYLRILPSEEMLAKCLELGFLPDHIICMQGPFSQESNEQMLREHHIKYLLTKQSGEAGGYPEKAEAARVCGAELVVLVPPQEAEGVSVEQMCEIIGNEVMLRLQSTQSKYY